MSFLKKIPAAGATLLLACGLMAPMAWADGDRIDAVIALGQSGEKLTIPGVEPDASSLLLELVVEPSEGAVEDLAFTPSLPNVRVDDVTVDEGTDTVKVVLSAGPDNLFADANGTVQLGTISMKAASDDVEATVKVSRFETMAASYASAEYPVDGVQAVYRVNSTAGSDGGDGPGGAGGAGGAGGNGQPGTTQTGYNPSSDSSLTRTGDILMYAVIGLVVVAAAAGVGLAVRARKQSATKEK